MVRLRDRIIDTLAAEIKTRHYSRKTLKAYADWVRKFQHYLRDKPPNELFSIEDGILTVHGKGDKDRSVPLPQRIVAALKGQIEAVSALHEKDLADSYSGVFLRDSLEKKYPYDPNNAGPC